MIHGQTFFRELAQQIRAKLGGEPIFQQETDPALIGGVNISRLIDGIAVKLEAPPAPPARTAESN